MNKLLLSSTVSAIVLSVSSLSLAAAPVKHHVVKHKTNVVATKAVATKKGAPHIIQPIQAETTQILPTPANHAYFGLQVGPGGMDTNKPLKSAFTSYEYDRKGFAGRVFGSYLWTMHNFAIGPELGFMTYPKNHYTLNGVKSHYAGQLGDLLFVVKHSCSRQWNVFGKFGGAYVRQELTIKDTVPVNLRKHQAYPETAVGIGYAFSKKIGMDVSYTHVFGDKPKAFGTTSDARKLAKVAPVNALLLGLTYNLV